MSQKHVLAGKRIVVAGAGLAGLAFARALEVNWPSEHPKPEVVLYERSSENLDRSREGYTMGIRRESGLLVLKKLGLLDTALQHSTTTSDDGTQVPPSFWKKDWTPMLSIPGGPMSKDENGMPTIDIRFVRHVLRQVLLGAVPAGTKIHWDTGCDWTEVQADGKVKVGLSNGSTDECDVLIAADGANSKVRSCLVPDAKLDFAGAVCFMGTSKFPSGKPEPLKNGWGMNISGEGVCFLTFPVDSTSGVWALTYRSDQPRERVRGEDAVRRKDEILDEVRQRGKMFAEPFGQFIEATDPQTLSVFNAMHKYPLQHATQVPDAKVMLIGDANHPMSPFSGNGANMALMDAWMAAEQLARCSGSVQEARDAFDAESAPRSKSAIDRSWLVIRILHAKGITFWLLRILLGVVNFVLKRKR